MNEDNFKEWIYLNLVAKGKGISQITEEYKKYLKKENIDFSGDLELQVLEWLLELEAEEIIERDENLKFIYKKEKLDKKQKKIISKSKLKGFGKYLLVILFILLVIGIIIGRNMYYEYLGYKRHEKDINAVTDVVMPIAKKYKVNDLKVKEYDSTFGEFSITYDSNDFFKLLNKDKLLLLEDIYIKVYDNEELFDEDSYNYEDNVIVHFISKGNEYKIGFSDDKATLIEDNEEVYSLKTDFSEKKYNNYLEIKAAEEKRREEEQKDPTRRVCKGSVGCRAGYHGCNPNDDGYCVSCCHNK